MANINYHAKETEDEYSYCFHINQELITNGLLNQSICRLNSTKRQAHILLLLFFFSQSLEVRKENTISL